MNYKLKYLKYKKIFRFSKINGRFRTQFITRRNK